MSKQGLSETTQEVVCPKAPAYSDGSPHWYKEFGEALHFPCSGLREAGAAQDDTGCWEDVRKSIHKGSPQAGCRVPFPADGGGQSSEFTLSEWHE